MGDPDWTRRPAKTEIIQAPYGDGMQVVRDGNRWMLRLTEGEDLFRELEGFASAQAIRAAAIVSGIGMLREATVGFWDGRTYNPKTMPGGMELVGLHGSIAIVDGKPSVHLHAALGGPSHALEGGHLLRAVVGVVGEVFIESFPGKTFGRPLVESVGLRVLDLEPAPNP